MSGAEEFHKLSRDFLTGGARVGAVVFDAFKAGGQAFAADWRHNAKATAGKHGKHYPDSITSEVKLAGLGVTVETGPDSSKPQGGMGRGFEFGSSKQPPHLDGLHTLPIAEKRIDRLADAAIGLALP